LERTAGTVHFDEVSFAYRGGNPLLRNINFEIRPGERIAIIGPSGAGKTTLLSLLVGLYSPGSGCIRLNGIDTRELSQSELRRHIGYVPQEVFLFSGSIRDNIRYSDWDAGESRIREAARRANLEEFIERLPLGYDTPIGELGTGISGGQKQRIAIARSLLPDPCLFVLDEITSQQDQSSEQMILDMFAQISRDKALIVVTHSPRVLDLVERIVVVDQGRIVSQGTHDELYTRSSIYREVRETTGRGELAVASL
jgi:ATP-binding cassette subfamily B protein